VDSGQACPVGPEVLACDGQHKMRAIGDVPSARVWQDASVKDAGRRDLGAAVRVI